MRVAKEWSNNKVTYYGKKQISATIIAVKKMSEHKESACEKAALKFLAKAETLPNIPVKTLACEKEITLKKKF
jgi:hypothetical protein